ncbi:hypothetical protein OCU04_012741 [Sclerotinia nivalis]|uniref:Uncharacterized protein n=1 Tax=Sclerotinia nivalis TaxID=352851 RepID=A0A9X0DF67_9HELO|nr:hypothetical protein OCU04_012741 [Sclerotinia nivalis]
MADIGLPYDQGLVCLTDLMRKHRQNDAIATTRNRGSPIWVVWMAALRYETFKPSDEDDGIKLAFDLDQIFNMTSLRIQNKSRA